jgi:hypothetical protein
MSLKDRIRLQQQAFLKLYVENFGNVTTCCKILEIERCTYYDWLKKYKKFKQQIESVQPNEILVDFLENKWAQKVKEGDVACIIYGLKAKGKERGWSERIETEMIPMKDGSININYQIVPDADHSGASTVPAEQE